MSREMLNDQTWSSEEIRSAFSPGRASMSYGGVAVKTGLFLVVIAALAAVGWVTSETFTGRGSGLVYLVGFIVLIGLACKNAILIVEFAKAEEDKGKDRFEAAVTACRLRLRPILMTAFSFILGIFPLVIASGAGAEARKVMGMALLGGMTLATLLGVFFYPMLFVLIGKLGRYEQKREAMKATENNA